jgi:hypothetical protein
MGSIIREERRLGEDSQPTAAGKVGPEVDCNVGLEKDEMGWWNSKREKVCAQGDGNGKMSDCGPTEGSKTLQNEVFLGLFGGISGGF